MTSLLTIQAELGMIAAGVMASGFGILSIRRSIKLMSTTSTLSFANIATLITQVANDNTASNNAVSAQIAEVAQLLKDYAAAVANGTGPTQAQLQSASDALTAVDQAIQLNTKNVQASAAAVTTGDPAAVPPVTGPITPTTP